MHDNAKPHKHYNTVLFLESNRIQIIDHPPYSPDLAPCDYWLFDYIKQRLNDEPDAISLTKSVTKIVNNISHSEYIKTLRKYIKRLENCIVAEGDYFEHFMK